MGDLQAGSGVGGVPIQVSGRLKRGKRPGPDLAENPARARGKRPRLDCGKRRWFCRDECDMNHNAPNSTSDGRDGAAGAPSRLFPVCLSSTRITPARYRVA